MVCSKCDWLDSINENQSSESLRARSRLSDDSFYNTPASTCYVPFKLQGRLLRAALRLAQETLWNALREHWPHIQRSLYLEGPGEIRFGREELYQGFGNETYPSRANEMCGQPRSAIVNHVLEVVYLRNAVCHPRHQATKDLDRIIKHAQGLAVVLQDESRATKIRRLRDGLERSAAKSYEEIKAGIGIAGLPFASPWPLHHQRLFETVRFDLRQGIGNEYCEVIKQAAREWQLKHIRPGEMDPAYLVNVEKAKSYVRTTDCGHRASVSTLPSNGLDTDTKVEPEVKSVARCPPREPSANGFDGW